jgi:DNA-binding response OmpR family regulator
MEYPGLRGRSILVVENELLIAMDIAQALESAGANATMTTTARHALILIEHDGLAGAIMDHGLSDGDSTEVCARLKARGIPYISYSGYDPVPGADPEAPFITKPVSMDVLMSAMEKLLSQPEQVSQCDQPHAPDADPAADGGGTFRVELTLYESRFR